MYAAMSAVQVMEPRMDVGMNPASNRSVADALASGAAPPEPTLEQTLQLCEGLLVCARGGLLIATVVGRRHLTPPCAVCSNRAHRSSRWRKPCGTADTRWRTPC